MNQEVKELQAIAAKMISSLVAVALLSKSSSLLLLAVLTLSDSSEQVKIT